MLVATIAHRFEQTGRRLVRIFNRYSIIALRAQLLLIAALTAASGGVRSQPTAGFIEPFPITSHPDQDIMPALSPDGRWIAFVSRQNQNYDIWVKPLSGGGIAIPLTTHTSDDFAPSWSPDGKKIAFISRREDARGDLYLLDLRYHDQHLSPGKLRRLTVNFERETDPQFSPDGRSIAYAAGPAGQEQVWIYDLKRKTAAALTTRGGRQPAWSPDGSRLLISAPTDHGRQIFLINSAPAENDREYRQQLTFSGDNHYPCWSSDGSQLLVQTFAGGADSSDRRVYLRLLAPNAPGAPSLQITLAAERAMFPHWGRDQAIYYCADQFGNLDIWRIPGSGRVPRFSTPEETFAAGQAAGDPREAILTFASIPYRFPEAADWHAPAAVEIGRSYLALGDTARATALFQQIAREQPDTRKEHYSAALELALLAGDPAQLAEIRRQSSHWPSLQARALLEIGRTHQRRGELNRALDCYQDVRREYLFEEEACYGAYLHAGEVLGQLGQVELCERSYLSILNRYPRRLDWRSNAIRQLLASARNSVISGDTTVAYQNLIQRYRDVPAIAFTAQFEIAEKLFRENETALAENEYRDISERIGSADDPYLQQLRAEALYRLMRLYIQDNEFPAAIQFYQQLYGDYAGQKIAAIPRARQALAAALVQRARLLIRGNDLELALSLLTQARELAPREVEVHRGYLEAMHALGRINAAVDEYERLLNQTPTDEVLVYALGLAYSYKGEDDLSTLRRSTRLLEQSLALNYRLIPAYLTLSFNYEAIENLEQKERARKKGLLEAVSLALPRMLDNFRRAVTFRPPRQPERWYERAIEALTLAIAINDEKTHPYREAQLALNLANNYYNLGEFGFENAYRYYQVKLRHDSTFASVQQRAIVYERIGRCGWVAGKYDDAEPFLQEAARLFRELGDVDGELRNLQRLALLYQERSDYDISVKYYRRVLNLNQLENRDGNIALASRNIAYNRQQMAETREAIQEGEKFFSLLEAQGKGSFPKVEKGKLQIKLLGLPIFWWTIDPVGESNTEGLTYEQERELVYSIIEESYIAQKDFRPAIAVLEKKAASFRERKHHLGEAIALNNLGNLYYNLHDFPRAADYFLQSYRICDKRDFPPGKVINLINLGNLFLLARQRDIPLSDAALPSLEALLADARIDVEEIGLQVPRQKLAVMNTLGNLYFYNAEAILHPVAAPEDANAAAGDPALTLDVQRSLNAFASLGRALAPYDSALAIAQRHNLKREEVIVRRNLAGLFMMTGDYFQVLQHLSSAREICIANNYPDLLWRVTHALANLRRFRAFPAAHPEAAKTALDWYLGAIEIMEDLPADPEEVEQRIIEEKEQALLYENAIRQQLGEGMAREALQLSERYRANRYVGLVSSRYIKPKKELHLQYWGGGGGAASDARRRISRLRGELRKLEAEVPPRPEMIDQTRRALAAVEQEYREVVAAAEAEDPELASFFSIQEVNTRAVQDSLDPQTAVLIYLAGEDELLIWRLAQDGVAFHAAPLPRSELRRQVNDLNRAWEQRSEASSPLARDLGKQLLPEALELDNYTHVVIIPDDALFYLPFAALQYQGDRVADLFLTSRASSLRAWQYARRKQKILEHQLLWTGGLPAPGFPPGCDPAAVAAAAGMGLETLAGQDWRRGEARQQVLQANILHLGEHFTVNSGRVLDSGFRLGFRNPETGAAENELLPVYQLFEYDLNAGLVVLEQSEFPYREGHSGEEIIALQRSLIYAGAPSIIMNQWPVTAAVREAFYRHFYQSMQENSLVSALSKAQFALREEYPDPRDWAGFQLYGFAGMDPAEREVFARRYFMQTVLNGNRANDLGYYADAVRYYLAALAMARQLQQEEAIGRLYLLIKNNAVYAKDFATASEAERRLLEIAQQSGDVAAQARSYRNLAVWERNRRNFPAAVAAEQSYLALAQKAGSLPAAADSRLQLAQIYQAAGDYPRGIAYADTARRAFAELGMPFQTFQAASFLGKLYLEDDRYPDALAALNTAVADFQAQQDSAAAADPASQKALATAYQLLGATLGRLTAYGQAQQYHEKALDLFSATADTANITRAAQFLAEISWYKGDYQSALYHQQQALRLIDPRWPGSELLVIRGQAALGLIWLSLGDPARALEAEKEALQAAIELEEISPNEARREQATVYKNIGLVHIQQQAYPRALQNFQQATRIDRQLQFERGLLYDYLNLAQVYHTLARPDSAARYLALSENLAKQLSDQRAYAKTAYYQGLLNLARADLPGAQTALLAALQVAENNRLAELHWRCLWQLGVIARRSADLPAARDYFLRALDAVEQLSASIKIEEFRSGFIDNKGEMYESAVQLLIDMNRPAEALQVAERAKSRSFADMLANSETDWQAGADSALTGRLEALGDSIRLTEGKVGALQQRSGSEGLYRNRIGALNDSLAALRQAYSDLLVQIKAANPELADAVSVDPLPLAEIQAMLGDHTLLLEYFFAGDNLVCWVVGSSQVQAVATPLQRAELAETIGQFRRAIQKRASTERFSRSLYDVLIRPLEAYLPAGRQLVLVPHGVLHYLPFPALRSAEGSYLIDRHPLALAPSATVLGFCVRKGSRREGALRDPRLLALGNPDVGDPAYDLPFAEKEIKSLERTFARVESYLGKAATRRALEASAGQADILHFSCHGVYDEQNPLFSALLLAPQPGTSDNGRLEAHQIFTLRLNASLVTLSACETGLQKVTGGDEVVGLARSFIFAGAPSLVSSLWTVDDLATAITLKRFYRYLGEGMGKAEALRQAQQFVRDYHNRHPAYWASFSLTGDWR